MKVRRNLLRGNNPDRIRQQRIEGPLKLIRAQFGFSLKVRDLAGSMNARVGTPRGLNLQPLLRKIFQHIAYRALNRRLSGLDLPSTEISSVISQREFDILHRLSMQLSHDHVNSLPEAHHYFKS
jgi:hypothetical protein